MPNGVNATAYRRATGATQLPFVDLPTPVAGVVGQLSSRIDIDLLFAVLDAGCSLLLVGPVVGDWESERFAALLAHPNVRWVGAVPYETVAEYLRVIDVGITPYADSPFNRASFPLKTLEYLAAGKPVVSTDLPAVRWLRTDLVTVANRENFGSAARAMASQSSTPELVARRLAFAEQNAWEARAVAFAGAIGLTKSHRESDRSKEAEAEKRA
ncbi:MAG: glycosyltransferase [Burkholderiales bacterium]